MITLGINAAFHDPAACLVKDGRVLAAAEEERFNRVKHGKRPIPFSAYELPFHAIDFCLAEAGLALRDVDQVGYSFDPYPLLDAPDAATVPLPVKPGAVRPKEAWGSPWDPLFLCYVLNAPMQLIDGAPHHLEKRFKGATPERPRWTFVRHHLAHAASAFHASPYESAAVMTLDGRGENTTTSYGLGEGTSLRLLGEVGMPHSLGLLYEEVTEYLGFLRSCDEYKVMALASYGRPRFASAFRELIRPGDKGSYTVEAARLVERFGPPRRRGQPLEPRHFDLARSLQDALEEAALGLALWLRRESGEARLALAGGVALNCVMNARLRDSGIFESVWVQPAAGDAGTALGAAPRPGEMARAAGPRWSMPSSARPTPTRRSRAS